MYIAPPEGYYLCLTWAIKPGVIHTYKPSYSAGKVIKHSGLAWDL